MKNFFDRVIRGTGLTTTQNVVSWTVLALGFAYYYHRQYGNKESEAFNEQSDWNKQILEKQKIDEERKKRLNENSSERRT